MAKYDPFEQTPSYKDQQKVEEIKTRKDTIFSALQLIAKVPKSTAVVLYLTMRLVFGAQSKVCTIVFQEILKMYSDDEELQKYYWMGVEDASKIQPYRHFDKRKRRFAYEEGRKNGTF